MNNLFRLARIAIFLPALFSADALAREYFLVTDLIGRQGDTTISSETVKQIFLGEKLFAGENRRVYALLSRLSDASAESFQEDVLGMQKDDYAAYWRRKLFAGKGHPPKEFSTDEQAIQYALVNRNCLALVSQMPRRSELRDLRLLRYVPMQAAFVTINPGP
jgi:hypothetical protein